MNNANKSPAVFTEKELETETHNGVAPTNKEETPNKNDDHHLTHHASQEVLNQRLTLEAFRTLVGIPDPETGTTTTTTTAKTQPGGGGGPSWFSRRRDRSTSLYHKLVSAERRARLMHGLVDFVVYASMVAQMAFAASLIILGALNGDYHIAVAVIGAFTGVLTGVLSLLKGQGLPNRYIRYADEMRRIRDDVEFMERGLRSGAGEVRYGQVLGTWRAYEAARDDAIRNHPSVWTVGGAGAGPQGALGALGGVLGGGGEVRNKSVKAK